MIVNFVYEDEELLEPYEWQDDDDYKEFHYLAMYRVNDETLYDFMYSLLKFEDIDEDLFIVGNASYHFVVEIKNHCIYKRGSLLLSQRSKNNKILSSLPFTTFHYTVLATAYEKEFGLTRKERLNKQLVEEYIEDLYQYHPDLFMSLCFALSISESTPKEAFDHLMKKIEKGYTSLHDNLFHELIEKP